MCYNVRWLEIPCTTITNDKYIIEYVLGVLNSRIITWYYRTTTAEEGKVFAQIKIILLRQLPILIADKGFQSKVKYIVEEIHELRQRDEQKEIRELLKTKYPFTYESTPLAFSGFMTTKYFSSPVSLSMTAS